MSKLLWVGSIRFSCSMGGRGAGEVDAAAVLRLCGAVRDAIPLLGIQPGEADDLRADVMRAAAAAETQPVDTVVAIAAVKLLRHRLMEIADGPVAAVLADSAARIVGDGFGRLFS
jgi:hypothetical protein